MVLEKKDVEHIAELCSLKLASQEIKKLSQMLTDTLDYIGLLEELDTKNVLETYQVNGLTNVFKNDSAASTTLSKKGALSNASEEIDGKFGTEAVFERE